MPAKRPPVPLSRERIIDAALHIADGQGLRRLTMRRLGDALQVEAMAVYHHLPRGKEALMDALAEHVTAVQVAPGPDGSGADESGAASSWQELARAWARASRTALLEHPGVLSLALVKPPKGAALLSIGEQIEQLRDAGLGDAAPAAVRALRAYVFGSVAVEVQQSGWADPDADVRDARTAEGEREFEQGLDALIAGLGG
ncbi:TetR/AcrR family transcriptional regulator C-terminal domain-containing protein [Sphaerimonospora cavernae]|uniref:TetR/AcrR family transcriptional regulator C-terminal domain-containing protein n=1 Tax=Sphaerimonospora cavernae TaxID=1740611 RepID=A0ABV6U7S7_9ACTN